MSMRKTKKRINGKKLVKRALVSVVSVILVLTLGVVLGIAPFVVKYYVNAYENKGTGDREDSSSYRWRKAASYDSF